MQFSPLSLKRVSALAALGLLTGLPISAHAVTQTFTNTTGVWDGATANWTGAVWDNSGTTVANFSGTSETVNVGAFGAGQLNVGGLTVSGGTPVLDNTSGDKIVFNGGTSSGNITINNVSGVELNSGAQYGTVAVNNGGQINVVGSSATSLGAISNSNGGFAGSINAGTSTLTVPSLSLSNADPGTAGQNVLAFTLPTQPNTSPSGRITVGSFTVATSFPDTTPNRNSIVDFDLVPNGAPTVIAISGTNITGQPLVSSYTLIDWTSLTAAGGSFSGGSLSNSNVNEYFSLDLSNATGVNLSAATHLEVQGNSLVLVAVPEPATFAMPLAACLGLLVLRRRATRMPLVQA